MSVFSDRNKVNNKDLLKWNCKKGGNISMKKTRKRISLVCLLLVCTIMVSITGCSAEVKEVQARNLMESISANHVDVPDDLSSQNADVTDFAVRLFKAGEQSGKNLHACMLCKTDTL